MQLSHWRVAPRASCWICAPMWAATRKRSPTSPGAPRGDRGVRLPEAPSRAPPRRGWTPALLMGPAVPADMPVAVLVSGRTFSSGEALAYHLQARGRVTIVGERTPGAADHVTD